MRQKRVTSLDVARQAGVSRTTVSLVLNKVNDNRIRPETVERVLEAARELGYVPDAAARALASRRMGTVGFLLSQRAAPATCGASLEAVLAGLTEGLREHNLHLLFDLIDETIHPQGTLDLFQSGQIDGLILAGAPGDNEALLEQFGNGLPVILLGSPGMRMASVTINHTAAARAITTHLIQQGAGRVALISHEPREYSDAAEILLGYRLALEAAGLPFDAALVRSGPLDPGTGSAQMLVLLEMDDAPDAVFAAADLLALGALSALQARGVRIPSDLSLAGYGDIPLAAHAYPPLTSVRIPAAEMARRAAGMLAEMIGGHQPAPRQVVLEAEIQLRASSAGE